MKEYPLFTTGCCFWKVSAPTYSKIIFETLTLLDEQMEIFFEDRLRHESLRDDGLFAKCHLVVDGTVCPMDMPVNTQHKLANLSGKHHLVVLKYEVGVNIATGIICWVYGPLPGAQHDMRVLCEGPLLGKLQDVEKLLVDKGYVKENLRDLLIYPKKCGRGEEEKDLPPEEQRRNRNIQLVRSIVEHAIGRIKRFSILRKQYRSNRALHGMFFQVAAKLTNVDFEYHPLRRRTHPLLLS